jgi:hypothetical protein
MAIADQSCGNPPFCAPGDGSGSDSRGGRARIAVIVPAYGVAHLVPEALESLLAQTEPAWECVVIDDGAPDDVAGAVAPFLSDPRIRFLATDNRGVSAARNRAVAATSAPLVTLLDGDDLFRPGYLARMADMLEGDGEARIATCNARLFGAVPRGSLVVDRKQGTGDGVRGSLSDVLDRSFNVYIGSAFRRADFDRIGGFDEAMAHAEDLDLWIRLMLLGGHALYADEVLGEYRVRPGSASASGAKMLRGTIRAYEKAFAALGDRPEAQAAAAMIRENRAALAFEEATRRVMEGETAALCDLRAALPRDIGRGWSVALGLWEAIPALAPPMLRWRRRANSRGSAGTVAPLGAGG